MKSETGTIDLGEELTDAPKEGATEAAKTIYPSLYLHNVKDHEAFKHLGEDGHAKIKFKKTSHTTHDRNGKKSHSFELEIHSITPEGGTTAKSGMSTDSKTNADEDAIEKGLAAAAEEAGEPKESKKEENAETE